MTSTTGVRCDDQDAGLTTAAAAELLGYSARTLENWRRAPGLGPDFYTSGQDGKAGVRYRRRALVDWQERREMLMRTKQAAKAAKGDAG